MTKTHKELLNVVMNMNQFEKYESIQVTLCRNSSVILKLWVTCPTEYKDIGNISSDSFNCSKNNDFVYQNSTCQLRKFIFTIQALC